MVRGCAVCSSNLAGVLRYIIQAGRQQVIFHGHVQMPPILVRQQGVQVSRSEGQRQKAAILDQFCPKAGRRGREIYFILI